MAHSPDDLSKLPQKERRRLIFLKSASKYRDLGMPIDGNRRFMELIERWIDGEIEMRDVAAGARQPISDISLPVVISVGEPPEATAQSWETDKLKLGPNIDIQDVPIIDSEPLLTQEELLKAIDELAHHGVRDQK